MTSRSASSRSTPSAALRSSNRTCIVAASIALAAVVASCGSDSTAPVDPLAKVPSFIYVSNASGGTQLYTWRNGVSTLFPGSIAGDVEPQRQIRHRADGVGVVPIVEQHFERVFVEHIHASGRLEEGRVEGAQSLSNRVELEPE